VPRAKEIERSIRNLAQLEDQGKELGANLDGLTG